MRQSAQRQSTCPAGEEVQQEKLIIVAVSLAAYLSVMSLEPYAVNHVYNDDKAIELPIAKDMPP
jgi:hypothetical protein